jgi:hypothetical protein
VSLYGGFAGTESSITERNKVTNGKVWEFTNPTIIDGNNTDHQGIITLSTNTIPTYIDGLTITKFKSTNAINGVGVIILNNWTMQNCIIAYNSASNLSFESKGAGVFVKGGKLLNSFIHHNENIKTGNTKTYAGGVYGASNVSPATVVKGCLIENNTTSTGGGGIALGELVDTTKQPLSIEQVHAEVWGRRIDKHGIILDFLGEIPTPEDCTLGRPNSLGWWSPIENGPMFTGIYLAAQCERARRTNDPVDKTNAIRLAQGLLKCASVSDVKGFIARGIGTDDVCHYPIGSDDQTHPWFYGLHAYYLSNIPTAAERTQIREKMLEVANALESSAWQCYCDGDFKGQYRGGFKGKEFSAVSLYLYMLRAMCDVTQDILWLNKYKTAVKEIPSGSTKTRLQICAEGYVPDVVAKSTIADWSLWTYVGKQGSLARLISMETDETIKSQFRLGLNANVESALISIDKYKMFDNNDTKVFGNTNWRLCYPTWYAQSTITDALNLSATGDKTVIGLRKNYEAQYMRNPLAAAAIIALAGDGSGRDTIENCIRHYDFSKINMSELFYAEVAYYAIPQ